MQIVMDNPSQRCRPIVRISTSFQVRGREAPLQVEVLESSSHGPEKTEYCPSETRKVPVASVSETAMQNASTVALEGIHRERSARP